MKVYDCFTFFNELDLLEVRLNELDSIVDYFVIVEGTRTFQNNPKPMYYLDNIDRFAKFTHKIIRVEVSEDQYGANPWDNENKSWNSISKGLHQANDGDIIMISALDEIPRNQSVLQAIQGNSFPVCINTKFFYFHLNTMYANDVWGNWTEDWKGPYVTTYNLLNKGGIHGFVAERAGIPAIGDGWHYSFLGDAKNAVNKVHSYSHSECNHFTEEFYDQQIKDLKDVFGRSDVKFFGFYPMENLPQYIQENLDRFDKYIRK